MRQRPMINLLKSGSVSNGWTYELTVNWDYRNVAEFKIKRDAIVQARALHAARGGTLNIAV